MLTKQCAICDAYESSGTMIAIYRLKDGTIRQCCKRCANILDNAFELNQQGEINGRDTRSH